ncbi:S8 family serine peptidase [Neobacillus soli]|uniref:S8 family serine peptidase n=1 Tax=Neobacillus soli TaxID=220688 RepID=UPI000825C160|nr:S8 family serine peptidase [Neobacillus soli]
MKFRQRKRLFSSFLALTMIFTLLFPGFGAAQANSTKSVKKQVSSAALTQMKTLIAQQKAGLSSEAVLHPDLQNLSGDKEVAVIVELSDYPVALVKGINKVAGKTTSKAEEKTIQQKVVSQQQKFQTNLSSKGIKAKVGYTYNYTFNGMALTLKASQVKELLKVDGVKLVEPDVERHALGTKTSGTAVKPAMNTSSPFLDVPSVWALGYKGQGVKVAVLDTGIDYNHPEFQNVYKGGYNFVPQTDTKQYARDRAADDPYETTPLDRPAGKAEFDANGSAFYTEHGTHVAGTIAAQGNNTFGIKGLAPSVELYAYRVLGAYGSGANSGVIAGIDKAAQEKMDVINLSLGGSSNSQTASDAVAINNAALAGVTAVIATGNSGPNRGTIGSPSTAAYAISVANSTVPETTMKGQASVTLEGSDPTSYDMDLMGWKFGTKPGELLSGTYDVVAVPGLGEAKDYNGLDVQGKVALISRGTIAFVDKIANAKKAGAVATIIHNNTGTAPAGVFLGDSFAFIPTFDMSTTNGNALRTALATKKATVTFGNFTESKTAGDDINSSSSRGPANPNFDLKPDVSAPGTNIMSSVPAYGKDFPDASYLESYDRFTGTSMATPHVAGIAALLKSEHPDWTPFDIKVAISNTAKQLDVKKYDVFSQGPGRVQPLAAATTEALAYSLDKTSFSGKSYDNIKGTVTFGNVPTNPNNASTITKDILVKNLTGNASDYTVTVQNTKAATGTLAAANVTVDKSNFTLAANGENSLKVTLNVPKGTGTTGNEILGYVKITNGKTSLNLPFAGNFAPPTGLKSFSVDSYHISPNGDKKLDSTTVRYEFYDRQGQTQIELWDASNPDGGYYGDGSVGYIVGTASTTTGPKTGTFNGGYTEWNTGAKKNAPDGVYTLDLASLNTANNAISAEAWLGPVFIKTTAPKIVVDDTNTTKQSNYDLSGSLQDSYVNWKSLVEETFGEDYDVNSNLHVNYELTNSNGEKVGEAATITLDQDGTFKLALSGLTLGENKVKLTVDDEGQNHAEKEIVVNYVDNDAPVTTAKVTGTEGTNGWYTSDVTVELSAKDEGTGVKSTEYKLNDGEWSTYTKEINLSTGTTAMDFRSTDNNENVETTQSLTVKIDKTAPIVSGVKNDGLYNHDVAITFNEGTATLDGKDFATNTLVSEDGNHTLVVTDEAGNKTTVTFTIDKIAPEVNGVEDGFYNHDVTITFNEGEATLNGKDIENETKVSEEGSYTLVVTDAAGNSTVVNFTIDKKVPQVIGVADYSNYNHFVTILFDKGTATLNGSEFKSGNVSEEGTYTLVVTDKAGNVTTVHFTIDTTAPVVSGVENFGLYNQNVTLSFNELGGLLNGQPIPSGTVVSQEGSYLIEVTDAAGNITYKFFTIDKTAPVVSGVTNNGLYNKDVTVSFNEGTATLNGKEVKSGTAVKTNGVYTVVVTDAAGNKTTVKFTIDKTAPTAAKINQISDKSTKVTGKAEANATVKLYIAGKYQRSVTADKSGNYSFTIKKQKAGTEIKVTATDKAGNVSKAAAVKVVDKTAPSTPKVDKVTVKSTKVTGKAEAGSKVVVKVGSKVIGTATADKKGNFSAKIAKQKAGKTLSVTAADKAGNVSAAKKVTVKK